MVRSLPIGSHIWPVRSRQFLSILHDKYSNWQSDHLNHCLKYFVFTYVSSTTGKNWWTYRTNCSSLSILLMTMIVKWYNGLLNSWILDGFQLADCLLLSFFFFGMKTSLLNVVTHSTMRDEDRKRTLPRDFLDSVASDEFKIAEFSKDAWAMNNSCEGSPPEVESLRKKLSLLNRNLF